MNDRTVRAPDLHGWLWRSVRWLIAAPLALAALAFGAYGLWIVSLECTRTYKDTPYWQVGGIVVGFGALFARATWLILAPALRPWAWLLLAALVTLAYLLALRTHGVFGGELGRVVELALGSLVLVSVGGTLATAVALLRGR